MKTILLIAALTATITSSQAAVTIAVGQSANGTKILSKKCLTGDDNGSTVLSVSLSNFKGVISETLEVDLSWATMMESNVEYYEIQRSGDGMNFEDLDSVESKMKINTSDYQLKYFYTDKHPLSGKTYYRIKIIGKNGNNNLSPVILINYNQTVGTRIYPTLVQNNTIFVESDKNLRMVKMEFFDPMGKKISETALENLNGRQSVQISKSGVLPTGTYIARITSNSQDVKTQLFIVQNR
jgi:hypothetical protein